MSYLSDNVVLLQYIQEGAQLTRVLTVLKTRDHLPMVHRCEINERGLVLGEKMIIDSPAGLGKVTAFLMRPGQP